MVSESQRKYVSRSAKPFLKWAGGKQRLLDQYEPYLPQQFKRYVEPFLGGGAVFFHLWNTNRFSEQALLSDNNEELIRTFKGVKNNVEELIKLLAIHKKNHGREYFYEIRNLDRQDIDLSDVERAARTIYLNKTCYNGLYRVNSKGFFNVSMGNYRKPAILDEKTLRAANAALQQACFDVKDFQTVVDVAQAGDFVYLDPPYNPRSKTANFTSYTTSTFREGDQYTLAQLFRDLSEKGCLCMLSNSHTPFVLNLYQEFRIETVCANRLINSDRNGRGRIKEILVLNY